MLCGLKGYDEFVETAKEGFGVICKIIPFLVTMLVAIEMFKGAGGIDLHGASPFAGPDPTAFPDRSVTHRPDSAFERRRGAGTMHRRRASPRSGQLVSLMAATFYVAAVCFGLVSIKQTRHAIPAGLLADFAGVVASVIICRAVLGRPGQ